MRDERTFTATLACPSCGIKGRHAVVAHESREPGNPDGSAWDVRVHSCTTCWRRRAECIGLARERLRAGGELSETSRCQATWQGAIVRDGGHDPITGAIFSELLRQGIPPLEGATTRLSAASLGLTTKVEVS